MKRLVFVLIALLCFFLIACNEKQVNEKLDSKSVDNKINLESKRDLEKTNQEQEDNFDKKTQDVEQGGDELDNEITKQELEKNSDEKSKVGRIYSLQKAYELGILSLDDLKHLNDIHYGNIDFNEEIDKDIEQKIKNDYLYKLVNDGITKESSTDAISIIKYYGKYNGAYVVYISNGYVFDSGQPHYIMAGDSSSCIYVFECKYSTILVWSEEVNKSETEVTDSSESVQENENISELTGELNQTEETDNSDVIKHKEITLYDEKLINDARLKYLELFVYPRIPDASINDVYLYQFLGTYNDYLVGVFIYKYDVFLEEALSITVADLSFEYSWGYDILVYHDDCFYTLLEAYDNEFITYDDLSIIYRIYNEPLEKLLGFKVEANNEIASCFEGLAEDDYSEENWNEINEIFLGSKELISIQKSKYDIEYVKNKVICEMMSIRPKELTKEFLSKCFDLDEEKYIWKNEGDEDFTDDLIIVLLKKPIYYIELDLSVFGLDNAIEIKYVTGVTPPDSFYARNSLRLDSFRQIVFIHLEPLGKEKVIESIRKLEELEFVLCAEPNYIFKLYEEKSEDNNNIENTELTNETITSEVVAHRLSSLSANMSEVRTSEEFDDMNLEEEINKIEEDILKMSLIEFELFYKHYTMISFKPFRIIKFDDNLIIIAEMSDEEGVTKVEIFENVIPTNESILELAEGMDVYQIMKITGFPTAITTTTQEKRFNFHTDTNDPYKVVFDDDFKFIKVEPWIIDHGSIARVVSDKCDPENIAEASKAVLIKVDMTFEEVVEILGKPIAEFGSGAIWYEWNLDDQTKLQIQFRPSSTEDNNLYVLKIVDKE